MMTNMKLPNGDSLERVDVTLYRQIIGSLMYLKNTRPDICFVVNTLSQYMVEPRNVHLIAIKHVMSYITVNWVMASDMHIIVRSYYTDMQIQIG